MSKGALIDKLSKDVKILREESVRNELGGKNTSYKEQSIVKMYITSTSGDRTDQAESFALEQTHVAQTTNLKTGIQINDLLFSDNRYYRVLDIDTNAASVSIEAEFKLKSEENITPSVV